MASDDKGGSGAGGAGGTQQLMDLTAVFAAILPPEGTSTATDDFADSLPAAGSTTAAPHDIATAPPFAATVEATKCPLPLLVAGDGYRALASEASLPLPLPYSPCAFACRAPMFTPQEYSRIDEFVRVISIPSFLCTLFLVVTWAGKKSTVEEYSKRVQ
jgi:hypothetical protein